MCNRQKIHGELEPKQTGSKDVTTESYEPPVNQDQAE